MNFLKSCITSAVKAIIGLFLILLLATVFSSSDKSKTSATTGYLKAGAEYYDSDKNFFKNLKKVKVEISEQKVMTSSGKEVVQIYFLEGKRSGRYGYTYEEYISQ